MPRVGSYTTGFCARGPPRARPTFEAFDEENQVPARDDVVGTPLEEHARVRILHTVAEHCSNVVDHGTRACVYTGLRILVQKVHG